MTPGLAKALAFFDKNAGAIRDDVVPTGFFSIRQIVEAKGLFGSSHHHIKIQWDQLVSAGKAECKVFKVGGHRVTHYKVKE